MFIVLIAGLCLSLGLIIHMWLRRKGSPGWKIFWTIFLLPPYLGPIFYFAFYDPPSPKQKDEQLTDEKVSPISRGY